MRGRFARGMRTLWRRLSSAVSTQRPPPPVAVALRPLLTRTLLTQAASRSAPTAPAPMPSISPSARPLCPRLSINALTAAEAGNYSVLLSNACGSVVTVPATISSVTAVLPILYDMNLSDGWFRFTVETRIDFDYLIEYKNNLDDPAWTTLKT